MEPSLAASAPTANAYAATSADATRVSGRRLGAYLIDSVVLMGIVPIAIFFAVSQPTIYTDSPSCEFLKVRELVPSGQTCIEVTRADEGTWVLPTTGFIAAAVYLLVFLIAIEWLMQASTGMTIGKLLFGIRTVDASGTPPGVGKQFVRGLVWIIDGITLCLPIAAWSILLTKRNQRLGDLAAGTFVIRATARDVAGPGTPTPAGPVSVGSVSAGAVSAGTGPTYGAAPPAGYPAAPPVAATPAPTAAPAAPVVPSTAPPQADPTTAYTPTDEPTVIQPPASGPADGDATIADGAPTASATASATDGGPLWDPARNAYIQWDPARGTWLMYDDAASAWTPIS